MNDEIADAPDPTLSVPDSPDGEGEDASEGTTAPKEETAPADDEKKEDVGKEDAPAGHSEAFEKLLAKYGGDYDKLAKSIFEQYNSTARTHEQLAELRGLVEELRNGKAVAEEVEKAVADDPYVREINTDLASINEKAAAITAEMKGMVTEYQKMVTKVAKLEGALEKADDNERFEVATQLREAKSDLKQVERDYQHKKDKYEDLESRWKVLQRSLRDAEGQARSKVGMERQEAQRLQQEARFTRQEYNECLRGEAEKYGIAAASKTYNFINESFKARLSAHMRALQAQGVTEGIDIPKAVGTLMKEYAEATGLTKRFTTTSSEKASGATPKREANPVKGEEAKGATKEGKMSGAEWRARARQLMP